MSTLDEIRARVDAATPGPWTVDRNTPFSDEVVGIFQAEQREYIFQLDTISGDVQPSDGDMEFIAAARTDVPKLLAALDVYAADLNEHGRESFYRTIEEAMA